MGLFDFLDPIKLAFETWLVNTGVTVPPNSTLFMVLMSIFVSGFSGIINRLILDLDKLASDSGEMQKHTKMKTKAKETADRKLWRTVQKNEDRFSQLQKSTMMKRMLPSLLTIGPFYFVFTTLRAAFQHDPNTALNGNMDVCVNSCGVSAVLPFDGTSLPLIGSWFSEYALDPTISVAGFGFFYFLSAITTSMVIQKLFGINLSGMQNPGMTGR
jgi:uncharacterized membrane protein (DUF106 family)